MSAALKSGEPNALVVVAVMIQVADANSEQDKRGASLCVWEGVRTRGRVREVVCVGAG